MSKSMQKALGLTDRCERCKSKADWTTMSRFNTQMICPVCEIKEKAHPLYKVAKDREMEEVRRGNYNYAGIGLPADL